jgi:hypothetical protein
VPSSWPVTAVVGARICGVGGIGAGGCEQALGQRDVTGTGRRDCERGDVTGMVVVRRGARAGDSDRGLRRVEAADVSDG